MIYFNFIATGHHRWSAERERWQLSATLDGPHLEAKRFSGWPDPWLPAMGVDLIFKVGRVLHHMCLGEHACSWIHIAKMLNV